MYKERRNSIENKNGDNKKYGEQIPSLFSWLTPEEQKKRAKELEHITDNQLELKKDKKEKNRPS
ncbi:MAG: hypothetical protein IKE91_03880 [Clostridia bacterium]|nr:hypothetical protein [Clostridia bacterium]